MKLMLRPEWRIWPLSSCLGFLDLKTGVTVALLFALFNKVAGVYGLIAMFTGAGGSFAQFSLYLYSVVALAGLVWGLRAVKEEDPKQTLYFAHIFFADHILSTSWTVFFAVVWWWYTPHDGQRIANSKAQQQLIDIANITSHLTPAERESAAISIWNHEKGRAAFVIIISWIFKIYFIFLLYSYASHLRKGSYRSLPLSRPHTAGLNNYAALNAEEEEEEGDNFYNLPLRNNRHAGQSSISSMSEFINAPGRAPRKSQSHSRTRSVNGSRPGSRSGHRMNGEDVLFDETESTLYAGSSRGHSKSGTDDGTQAGTDDERGKGRF